MNKKNRICREEVQQRKIEKNSFGTVEKVRIYFYIRVKWNGKFPTFSKQRIQLLIEIFLEEKKLWIFV